MKGFIGMKKSDLDTINNDWFPNSEKTIEADSAGYYKGTANKFYIRTQTQQYAKQQIDYQQESVLLKICNLLKKHHTNYKIVISPLYDQVKLNPRDLAILKIIFGGSNVFDYSGINKITGYKYNYGNDVIHFRKKVGARIYQEIYK